MAQVAVTEAQMRNYFTSDDEQLGAVIVQTLSVQQSEETQLLAGILQKNGFTGLNFSSVGYLSPEKDLIFPPTFTVPGVRGANLYDYLPAPVHNNF